MIAIFYHTCINIGPKGHALSIIKEQVGLMQTSGLIDSADFFFVGINGEQEDADLIMQMMPAGAIPMLNPIETWKSSEVQTIRELREFAMGNPGVNILYLHMKGLSHVPGSPGHDFNRDWRHGMQNIVVKEWRHCQNLLSLGYESVGNWWNVAPNGSYWAGNFWWATSDFIATLPPIDVTGHHSGGRYEAEVWIGPRPAPAAYRCPMKKKDYDINQAMADRFNNLKIDKEWVTTEFFLNEEFRNDFLAFQRGKTILVYRSDIKKINFANKK